MAVCWISFRISEKTVGGKTYDDRYDALEKAVKDISSNYWKETTSFIVFETDTGFNTAARSFKAAIAPTVDLFLVRRMEAKKAIICGANDDDNIFDLMVDDSGESYLETI